jgi:flagellar hook-associated protein 1
MSISSILNIAKNSMAVMQTSLQVTSHNIANVNTVGYSRQEAVLTEATPMPTEVGLLGDGVSVQGIIRYFDRYLEESIAGKNTDLQEQMATDRYMERIESVLDENNSKLTATITDFFNGWQNLSTDPTSTSVRTSVVVKGENVSRIIGDIYSQFKGLQVELDNSVGKEVADVNRILTSIADLNDKVYEAGVNGGESGDYLDKRTELFKQLSGELDVSSVEDKYGRLTILTGQGKVLVDGNRSWDLATLKDQNTGFSRIAWQDGSGNLSDITDQIGGGKLKALISLRDETLGARFIPAINELAKALVTEVNAVHVDGTNLNGTTGIDFFKDTGRDYAQSMSISNQIKADSRNIAATSSAANPTDNDIALAIAALGENQVTVAGGQTTFVNYVSSLISDIGELAKQAKDISQYQQDTMQVMEKQKEEVSGVSIDDEMSNLIKFQYAYQASARLITVADELFKSILGAV